MTSRMTSTYVNSLRPLISLWNGGGVLLPLVEDKNGTVEGYTFPNRQSPVLSRVLVTEASYRTQYRNSAGKRYLKS